MSLKSSMLSESGEPREMVMSSGPHLGDDWSKMTQRPEWVEGFKITQLSESKTPHSVEVGRSELLSWKAGKAE